MKNRGGQPAHLVVPARTVPAYERRVIAPVRAPHDRLALSRDHSGSLSTVIIPAPVLVPMPATVDAIAQPVVRKKMALLLPAHNEEIIIGATIRSAVAAGQPIEDIYVVNDGSIDATKHIATTLLGRSHVFSIAQSGKAKAVKQAIDAFNIEARYEWLHVADADSIFSPHYFYRYRSKLDAQKYAVAVGFVQSLRGNWISTYRALTYTYSQHVTRRVQSYLGMISVFPGPITCFRADILPKLDFSGTSLTEDFDITLQVHRKKLGRIAFIPGAINYTQDPQTLKDFCRQNLRWQRGFFQGVKKYKIGLRGQKIDLSLGLSMLQNLIFVAMLCIAPFVTDWTIIPVFLALEIVINGTIALLASVAAKRWMLIGALPYFFFLRWLEVAIYVIAFIEVMVLRRFRTEISGWSTAGRRYQVPQHALVDVAK